MGPSKYCEENFREKFSPKNSHLRDCLTGGTSTGFLWLVQIFLLLLVFIGDQLDAIRDELAALVSGVLRLVIVIFLIAAASGRPSSPRPLYLTECLLIGPKENAA